MPATNAPLAPVMSPTEQLPPASPSAALLGDQQIGPDPELTPLEFRGINNFIVSNTVGLTAVDLNLFIPERFEINDAYNNLAANALDAFIRSNNAEFVRDSGRVEDFADVICPQGTTPGANCQLATAVFIVRLLDNVPTTNAPQMLANQAASIVQGRINFGELQCGLEDVAPESRVVISTGGDCPVGNSSSGR